jgi:hypothetical protein
VKRKSKWFPIRRRKDGRTVGWIEMFWCASADCYVTIPGVSKWQDARSHGEVR